MIPKRIFQTAKSPLPYTIHKRLGPHIKNWKYEFYDDASILRFFERNPHPEFPNIIERFHAFKIGQHKADLFRYYYLWLFGGVFMDSDAMIYESLDHIIKDYSFVTIKPHFRTAQGDYFNLIIFQGFLGAEPGNEVIYRALQHAYSTPIEEVNEDYTIFCRKMYWIIYQKPDPHTVTHDYMKLFNYRIYQEYYGGEMPYSVVHIDEFYQSSPIILVHYWGTKIVPDDDLKLNRDDYTYLYYLPPMATPIAPSELKIKRIPKIIHQLWIGPHPCPIELMNTWKDKHPDCDYILWDEEQLRSEFGDISDEPRSGTNLRCIEAYRTMRELVGKVDILRWEILYRYGGVFLDADSICLEPLPENVFFNRPAFASFENENVRTGLVAIGTMGFVPKHPLLADILDKLQSPETLDMIQKYKAWYCVGPSLLTRLLDTKKYSRIITIFPSYMFLPYHFTGDKYKGYKKIYAYQEWANTKGDSDKLAIAKLPEEFRPDYMDTLCKQGRAVSILVTSYNTCQRFLRDCFNSIRNQLYVQDPIGLEIVVIDDGSDQEHSTILKDEVTFFSNNVRNSFVKVIYKRLDQNLGVGGVLRLGVESCTNELIAIQDADDIMLPGRIETQFNYMMSHPDLAACSSAIEMFHDTGGPEFPPKSRFITKTHTPILRRGVKDEWITNHPAMMMRKSAILAVGNYHQGLGTSKYREDWDLIQRVLEEYGEIHNMQCVLEYYRLHSKQTSLNLLRPRENGSSSNL